MDRLAARMISNLLDANAEANLRAGKLPVVRSPIFLHVGEVAHAVEPHLELHELRTVTVARGSAGVYVNYKVTPNVGVRGRVGKTGALKEERWERTDVGQLIVTSKRLVLLGKSTHEWPLGKLVDVRWAKGELQVALSGANRNILLVRRDLDSQALCRLIMAINAAR
ncbi:MAG TPA: hypothetical protein VHN99_02160 [Deinococcales bacterium]|nr:hypothetical protein [Deinococcales bacterium]